MTDMTITVQHIVLENVEPSQCSLAYALMLGAIQGQTDAILQLQKLGAYQPVTVVTIKDEHTDKQSALTLAREITTSGLPLAGSHWIECLPQLPPNVQVDIPAAARSRKLATSSGVGTLLLCEGRTYACFAHGIEELSNAGSKTQAMKCAPQPPLVDRYHQDHSVLAGYDVVETSRRKRYAAHR